MKEETLEIQKKQVDQQLREVLPGQMRIKLHGVMCKGALGERTFSTYLDSDLPLSSYSMCVFVLIYSSAISLVLSLSLSVIYFFDRDINCGQSILVYQQCKPVVA